MTSALLDHDIAPAPELTGSGNPRTPSTPGRRPGQKNGTGRTTRTAGAPPRKNPPSSTTATKRAAPNYRPGVKGVLQILTMIPAGLSRMLRNPKHKRACAADVVAMHMHADNIAEAAQVTAENEPAFAQVLEKLMTIGPYGLLIAAIFELGGQVAVNHEVAPAGFMGARPAADLLAAAGMGPAEPAPAG